MLWLALHLPSISLDALPITRLPQESGPVAIVERVAHAEVIVACNEEAISRGIYIGQACITAQALVSGLRVLQRHPDAEAALLNSLASWALQFSPTVCIDPPAGVLLEIEGCLTYFGGLHKLRAQVSLGLAALSLQATQGVAPTPLAASWLARIGHSEAVCNSEDLAKALNRIPLTQLPLAANLVKPLRALGVGRLGALAALPRSGLSRRFGPDLLRMVDCAYGRVPDPREPFVAPSQFTQKIELSWATDRVEALLFVIKRLLLALSGFLSGRGLGVQQVQLQLYRDKSKYDELSIGFGKPTRSANAMLDITRERLHQFALSAPVEAIALHANELHTLDGIALSLFDTINQAGDFELLRARLAARLGEDAIRQIVSFPDHRPEYAWRVAAPQKPIIPLPRHDRPAWLLPSPQALEWRGKHLWHGELLQLIGRAERIESGWWDEKPIMRDYYLAEGTSGQRYWLFQQRHDDQWFLHGLFA